MSVFVPFSYLCNYIESNEKSPCMCTHPWPLKWIQILMFYITYICFMYFIVFYPEVFVCSVFHLAARHILSCVQ